MQKDRKTKCAKLEKIVNIRTFSSAWVHKITCHLWVMRTHQVIKTVKRVLFSFIILVGCAVSTFANTLLHLTVIRFVITFNTIYVMPINELTIYKALLIFYSMSSLKNKTLYNKRAWKELSKVKVISFKDPFRAVVE